MWKQEKEYVLAELLDHPVLTLALASAGMERRSITLLLEAVDADRDRGASRIEEPVFA
jgi:hypothetical protein